MKILTVLTMTAFTLSVGCSHQKELEPSASTVNPPAATPEHASLDWGKERQLVVQAPIPVNAHRGKDPQPLNARYTLAAKHGGKLLIRVRERLLVADPPAWVNATGSHESDGLAQRVLELSDEDLAAPLVIEARVVHPREPEEMVRVEFTLHRGEKTENWFNFYQCRPARKTTRAQYGGNFNTEGEPLVVPSGETRLLWIIRFGGQGDPAEVDGPLDKIGMQEVRIELGWNSNFDGAP